MQVTRFPTSDFTSLFGFIADQKGSKNPVLFTETLGSPELTELLEALQSASSSHYKCQTCYGYTVREKGHLNEQAYLAKIERLAGDEQAQTATTLTDLERDQKRMRIMYASGRIALRRAVSALHGDMQRVKTAIDALAKVVAETKPQEDNALFRQVGMNNVVVAKQLFDEVSKNFERMRAELGSDPTGGLAMKALQQAFSQMNTPVADRCHNLINDDMLFVAGLPGELLARFEAAFNEAYNAVHQGKWAMFARKENRGTLHEDQYKRRMEELLHKPVELGKAKANQRQVRLIHKSYGTALLVAVESMRQTAQVLEAMIPSVLVELATVDGPDLREAIISNIVFAEVLVRELLGRKMEQCLNELTVDSTQGAEETALEETFKLILQQLQ